MATIIREFAIDRPPTEVWKELAEVGKVNRVIDSLGEVTLDGDTRTCALGDAGHLEELIVAVDDERMRLAYAITTSPFNLTHHHASMQVLPDGAGSRVVWTTDLKPDEMAGAVSAPIDAAVASIESYFA